MIKRFALIGTFTLVLAAVALPVYAQTHVSIGIGAPFYPPVAVVSAAPYSGYVWQPAHYVWTAFGYQFVPAEWVPAPYVVHRRAYVAPPVWGAPYDAPGDRRSAPRGRGNQDRTMALTGRVRYGGSAR